MTTPDPEPFFTPAAEPKPGRGGRRTGAGAPALPPGERVKDGVAVLFYLRPDIAARVDRMRGRQSRANWLAALVDRATKMEPKPKK